MSYACIIPCCKQKIWDASPDIGPVSAKDAYISQLFKKQKRYACVFHENDWFILSAKYGVISPDFVIAANYNVTFQNGGIDLVSSSELTQQIERILTRYAGVVLLTGQIYVAAIQPALTRFDLSFTTPLKGLRIGKQLQTLNQSILTNTPLS